ncbi:MAG: sugar transferase [Christensenellales bacterium]|jgi:exopolysaccharide biosynthesis polyprenyl glycosylphosphotransferase
MDTLRKYRKSIIFINRFIFIAVIIALFVFVFLNYYEPAVFFFKGNIILVLVYIALYFVLALTYGCFRIGIFSVSELFLSHCLSIIITNVIAYFIICLVAREMLDIMMFFIMTLAQVFLGAVFYIFATRIYFRLFLVRNCVAIGNSTELNLDLFYKYNQIKTRFNIDVVLDERDGFDSLKQQIDQHSTVILGDINRELRSRLITYCFEKNIRIYVEPTMSDIMMHNAHETHINDSLVYLCRNRGPSTEQRIIKRLIDIVASVLGLIAFSPIMLLVAIPIKLYDSGPVFFKQKRLTLNGKEFWLIKFRSMVQNAEDDGIARLASKGDKRITPVGRIIRAARLDELPQIINILKGDMSLVGPRPERPEIMEEYCEVFPEFRYRLKMKAGLTGYAQIYGKYNTTFEDKVKMDLLYIVRYSVLFDIRLIFATIKTVFMKDSTEGIEPDSILPTAMQKGNDSEKENF